MPVLVTAGRRFLGGEAFAITTMTGIGRMQRVFEALASGVRRKILAYLAHTELSAGEIASRFDMSKPSISQHLSILEAAGLVESEKRGQFVFYRQVPETITTALAGFVQEACPVGRPLRRESLALAKAKRAAGK